MMTRRDRRRARRWRAAAAVTCVGWLVTLPVQSEPLGWLVVAVIAGTWCLAMAAPRDPLPPLDGWQADLDADRHVHVIRHVRVIRPDRDGEVA